MAELKTKSLDSPDEARPFEKGRAEIVTLGGMTVGRAVLEPGWRWSQHVKPIVGTESCQVAHTGYVVSGRLKVVMDDGSEGEAGAGDAYVIPPGHDAWTLGDEVFLSAPRCSRMLACTCARGPVASTATTTSLARNRSRTGLVLAW